MKTRVLIISLGSIGKRHFRNARTLIPDCEIAVLRHKRDPEGCSRMTSIGDYTELYSLDDAEDFHPHCVIIASPAPYHLNQAVRFIRRGIGVFIEKPLAPHSDGLDILESEQQASGSFCMVGYVLRFLPMLNEAKEAIKQGIIGRVLSARIHTGQYLPTWRPGCDYRKGVSAQRILGGGVLLELSHEVDYCCWLFGKPDGIYARVRKLSDLEIDVEDLSHLVLDYDDKLVAITTDFLEMVPTMSLDITGTKGSIKADLVKETATLFNTSSPDGVDMRLKKQLDPNESYLRQFDYFFSHTIDGYQAKYDDVCSSVKYATLAHAASVVRLLDLARTSDERKSRCNFNG